MEGIQSSDNQTFEIEIDFEHLAIDDEVTDESERDILEHPLASRLEDLAQSALKYYPNSQNSLELIINKFKLFEDGYKIALEQADRPNIEKLYFAAQIYKSVAQWKSAMKIINQKFNKMQNSSIIHIGCTLDPLLVKEARDALYGRDGIIEIYDLLDQYEVKKVTSVDKKNISLGNFFPRLRDDIMDAEAKYFQMLEYYNQSIYSKCPNIFKIDYALMFFKSAANFDLYSDTDKEVFKGFKVIEKLTAPIDPSIKRFIDEINIWKTCRQQLDQTLKNFITPGHPLPMKEVEFDEIATTLLAFESYTLKSKAEQVNVELNIYWRHYIKNDLRLHKKIKAWYNANKDKIYDNDSRRFNEDDTIGSKKIRLFMVLEMLRSCLTPEVNLYATTCCSNTQDENILKRSDWEVYGKCFMSQLNKFNCTQNNNDLDIAIDLILKNLSFTNGEYFSHAFHRSPNSEHYKLNLATHLQHHMWQTCDTLNNENFPNQLYKENPAQYIYRVKKEFEQYAKNILGHQKQLVVAFALD